jgi:replicative DNA helicase
MSSRKRSENLGRSSVPDVPTGIKSVDRVMPLLKGRFHLVGGVSSMGKTAFSLSVALGAAQRGVRVVLASPATSPFETRHRLAFALAGINRAFGILGWLGTEETQRVEDALDTLRPLPIRLLEEPLLGLDELHRALRPAGHCDFLVIDDLESMYPCEDFDPGACLQWLARWLRIPVIATIGLPMPDRVNPFPVLRDFPRELVRAADVTMALHRPVYYEGIDYSAPEREQQEKNQEALGAILWDRNGVGRGVPMVLEKRAGPVFV